MISQCFIRFCGATTKEKPQKGPSKSRLSILWIDLRLLTHMILVRMAPDGGPPNSGPRSILFRPVTASVLKKPYATNDNGKRTIGQIMNEAESPMKSDDFFFKHVIHLIFWRVSLEAIVMERVTTSGNSTRLFGPKKWVKLHIFPKTKWTKYHGGWN